MSIIRRMLKQTAVYWGPPTDDGDGGFTWGDPVEIMCRWETVDDAGWKESSRAGVTGTMMDKRTHETVDASKVYVSQDVELNGYLYFGSLSDVYGLTPDQVEGAKRINRFEKLPNLRVTEYLRTVGL